MPDYFETAPLPLTAANFDYFRLPPEKWPLLLARLAQLGLSHLILPVPWSFHQLQPDSIDLDGATDPRRNLTLLLKLCAGADFRCVLRTGPTLPQTGLLNDGLPLWLSAAAPEQIETETGRWLAALAKALVKLQWPAGPLAALWLNLPANAAPAGYSPQLTQVKWPIWLRKRYQSIDALNQAYHTSYRTVSDVEFPQHWSDPPTPLQADARAFLDETEHTRQNQFQQALADAGWQTPVHPFDSLPDIKPLAGPIHIDPCPPDICRGLSWADDAPLAADGAPRESFWAARLQLWQAALPAATQADAVLLAGLDGGGWVIPGPTGEQKIDLPAGAKPAAFRLNLDGSLAAEPPQVARGKLRADFRAAGETGPADSIFYLADPAALLAGPLADHLRRLLAAQRLALVWSAAQTKKLSEALTASPADGQPSPQPTAGVTTPYTIAEARRGLSRAESALKKAAASIGGLEAGFGTILGKGESAPPRPAAESVTVSAAIFDSAAQTALAQLGRDCAALVGQMKSAADLLQQTLAQPFTVEQYRQAQQIAVSAARASLETLLNVIEQLRLDIAADSLPLVAWRLHDQAQTSAETLRWGVLRR